MGYQREDHDALRRRVLLAIIGIFIFCGFFFGSLTWTDGQIELAVISFSIGFFMVFILVCALLYPRAKLQGIVIIIIAICFFIYLFATGGDSGSGFVWSFLLPIGSYFLLGLSGGFFVSIFYLLACGGLVILDSFTQVALSLPNHVMLLRIGAVYVTINIFLYAYESSIHKTLNLLYEQKAQFESLFTNTPDAIAYFDNQEKVYNINSQFTKLFGYSFYNAVGENINALIDPMQILSEYGSPKILRGETIEFETVRYNSSGEAIQVLLKGGPVYVEGELNGGYLIYSDITRRKNYEEELEYLSLHDKLTGLYNRPFFDNKLSSINNIQDYPITVIAADVDGLKLINDTLGHNSGDEILQACATVLRNSLRSNDIFARVGGDEFAIILLRADEKTGENLIMRMQSNIDQYNSKQQKLALSISFGMGMATAKDQSVSLEEIYKKADDNMYSNKMQKGSSAKSKILDALLAALGERDFETENHAQRLAVLSKKVGKKLNLSSQQLNNLTLLAQVHDLGKVGIPDNILFKAGPLTDEEWEVMRTHSEKGYRIASSSPEFSVVADLILKHHERWDGKGYPLGIKGEEIPLESRILTIVDSFDAMTSKRPYNKMKSIEEAMIEIKNCSGTQFDPELVEIFLEVLEEERDNFAE